LPALRPTVKSAPLPAFVHSARRITISTIRINLAYLAINQARADTSPQYGSALTVLIAIIVDDATTRMVTVMNAT
jgi:hypothetical protein